MRGRPPKPDNIHWLEGNRGKRSRPPRAAGVLGVPERPSWIVGRARQVWEDTARLMIEAGTLTAADGGILAIYCDAMAEHEAIAVAIHKRGRLYRTMAAQGESVEKLHPLVLQLNTLRGQLRGLLADLGLTPTSRHRVAQAAAPAPAEETIGAFLGATREGGEDEPA